SALRMWKERPVFGWGPGTYMFQYAPFQASEDRTIISTNFGVQGNAHSEYLGPLSEQGVPGLLLMAMLVVVTTVVAMRLYARMPAGRDRSLLMAAFLGLVTYYLHGGLNNFLDTDKASVPFWAFTALIVLLDLKYPKAGALEAPVT
ncbi:MAG: O-antigen ligase family protein, partial [Flavobacteriales bacterium]|nr:O-antigen ligase family protein [Flavobacteriales bacterium]